MTPPCREALTNSKRPALRAAQLLIRSQPHCHCIPQPRAAVQSFLEKAQVASSRQRAGRTLSSRLLRRPARSASAPWHSCSHEKETAARTQNPLILQRIIARYPTGVCWNIRGKADPPPPGEPSALSRSKSRSGSQSGLGARHRENLCVVRRFLFEAKLWVVRRPVADRGGHAKCHAPPSPRGGEMLETIRR